MSCLLITDLHQKLPLEMEDPAPVMYMIYSSSHHEGLRIRRLQGGVRLKLPHESEG